VTEGDGARGRPASWTPAAPWGARGWVADIDGPVHWVEFGGPHPEDAVPLVLVHGLGGSHLNWVLIGPDLAVDRPVLAIDLPGFGLSPGAGRDCSVQENTRVLLRFLDEVIARPVVLVGNSMGGAVSLLAAAAHPEAVRGVVLVDPALPVPAQRPDARVAAAFLLYLSPFVGEAGLRAIAARQTPRQSVERVIRACYADPGRAREDVLAASTALATERRRMPGTERSLVTAARSLVALLARRTAYRATISSVAAPVLLVHGEADRLVPVAAARKAAAERPEWSTVFLPGVGHTPQLESPDAVTDAIRSWLAKTLEPASR